MKESRVRIEAALKNLPALVEWQPGDTLKDLGVRSLVVSGETDPLTGGANAERAADALGATHVLMAGVGHSPIIEAPDDFMDIWLDFVGNREG